MSKGTTPKRFSTVDKNTFGTPCQIRLIRGGHKSTDLAGIVLQTLSEHFFLVHNNPMPCASDSRWSALPQKPPT